MSVKTKEYIKACIIVLLLIILIFVFDLPKNTLFTLLVIIPVAVLVHELFPPKHRGRGRKREYITAILFFLIFSLVVFFFDLPVKLYGFFGILATAFIILEELFYLVGDKESEV